MNNITQSVKIGTAAVLSVCAALLVVLGIQSQDKNYSVTKNVSDVVSSCWGTPVAHAIGGDSDGGDSATSDPGSVPACGDPWGGDAYYGGDYSADGDTCGDANSESGCGPY